MVGALGLTAHQSRLLHAFCVPIILFHAIDYIDQVSSTQGLVDHRDVDCLDAFSGKGRRVSAGFRSLGRKTLDFDILTRGCNNDILSTNGFLKLLQMALRVRPDGLASFGIPCGSYVFLNLPTHKRTAENPFGDESLEYVSLANQIGCRAALVMLVLICRAVYIFVEQPATSRLFISPYYVYIQEVCQRLSIKFYNSFFWMGCFGHFSQKPSRGWGTAPWIPRLFLRMTANIRKNLSSKGVTIKKIDPVTGKKTVSGGPKLKQSEEYLASFGRVLALRHLWGKAKKRGLLKSALKIAEKKYR